MDTLLVSGRTFHSRLFVGTGKFGNPEVMKLALAASGTEMFTVALRRVDFSVPDNFLSGLSSENYLILPNTSGAEDAEQAVRLARLALRCGGFNWIKLEVTPEPRYLLPDGAQTLKATEILVKEGFTVLPYINADPILAKQLEEAGAAALMPLGSPIGTNRGLQTQAMLEIIIEQAKLPVVVDAGLGAPSHAAKAMELGADAVLVNTAIAIARDPIKMAEAFKSAVEAGRAAYCAGLGEKNKFSSPTSPLTGFLK
ncbi:MAG: thiazole synthase [Deferribacteraceae bacterium]|nr:thiazole synthase [Deferribacteraceae bacterium]